MGKLKSNYKQKVAPWQREKMREIIANRWLETWEIVVNREIEKRTLSRFKAQYAKGDNLGEDL